MKASKKSQITYKILNIIECHSDVSWTVDKICIRLGQTFKDTQVILAELLNRGHLYINSGSYLLSDEGRTVLKSFVTDPRLAIGDNVKKFKEEALSGLKTHRDNKTGAITTRKSKIDRAVIPSNKRVEMPSTEDKTIEYEDLLDARKELSEELECTLLELDEWDTKNNQAILERYEKLVFQKLYK